MSSSSSGRVMVGSLAWNPSSGSSPLSTSSSPCSASISLASSGVRMCFPPVNSTVIGRKDSSSSASSMPSSCSTVLELKTGNGFARCRCAFTFGKYSQRSLLSLGVISAYALRPSMDRVAASTGGGNFSELGRTSGNSIVHLTPVS